MSIKETDVQVKGAWQNPKLMGIKIGHFGKYRTNRSDETSSQLR
jgi:hypothetical protein